MKELYRYELIKYYHEEPPAFTSLTITREGAVNLVGEAKLQEAEEHLKKTIQTQRHLGDLPPNLEVPISLKFPPLQTSITIKSGDFTSEDLEITYFPIDLLLEYIDQNLLTKARLSKKLPEILSATHLTLANKKKLLVLTAYRNREQRALLTTTSKNSLLIEALRHLIELHRAINP